MEMIFGFTIFFIALYVVKIVKDCFLLDYEFEDEAGYDNSDGHVTCGQNGKPCIKYILYPKSNDCTVCPIYLELQKEKQK